VVSREKVYIGRAGIRFWPSVAVLLAALVIPGYASAATVSVIHPAAGETVKGTVRVEATASAGPGNYPTSINFYDGVNHIGGTSCQNQQSCNASVEWHATGLSGSHSLTATVDVSGEPSATSAPVVVTVVSPPPTVTITSPKAGQTVAGTIDVSAEGATDPSQDDYPRGITLYDGVNYIGNISCQGQQSCQGQVVWRATGLTGAHTLTARVQTNNGLSITSQPVTVTVVSPPPKVAITRPANGTPLRSAMTITVSGATNPTQDDYPTIIYVFDGTSEIGYVECQGQQTCAGSFSWNTSSLKGRQVLTAKIRTHTDREAISRPVIVGGGSRRLPHAKGSCHIASHYIQVRHRVRVSCVASGVSAGTVVAIQYRTASRGWTSLFRERIPASGHFFFTVHGKRRSVIQLSVIIAQSRYYAATRILLGSLHIT